MGWSIYLFRRVLCWMCCASAGDGYRQWDNKASTSSTWCTRIYASPVAYHLYHLYLCIASNLGVMSRSVQQVQSDDEPNAVDRGRHPAHRVFASGAHHRPDCPGHQVDRWVPYPYPYRSIPFSGQFRRQCMQFGNSAGSLGGSAFRRPFGHDSAGGTVEISCTFTEFHAYCS